MPKRDDAHTPDTVDAEAVAGMSKAEVMDCLRIDDSRYDRMMRDIEGPLADRANREPQKGVTIPMYIMRTGARRVYRIPRLKG